MRFVDADVARSVRQANRIQNVSITKNTCTYLYVYLHKTFLERNKRHLIPVTCWIGLLVWDGRLRLTYYRVLFALFIFFSMCLFSFCLNNGQKHVNVQSVMNSGVCS